MRVEDLDRRSYRNPYQPSSLSTCVFKNPPSWPPPPWPPLSPPTAMSIHSSSLGSSILYACPFLAPYVSILTPLEIGIPTLLGPILRNAAGAHRANDSRQRARSGPDKYRYPVQWVVRGRRRRVEASAAGRRSGSCWIRN